MATKITKKEKKELDELEDELLFLSSKKKELEEKYASLKKENDSRQDNFVLALKEEYSSSLDCINNELSSLTRQEETLMNNFSSLLESFNDDSNDIKIYLSLLKGREKDE